MRRTAEQKQAIAEATVWVREQMATHTDDIVCQDLVEKFGISVRAAQEIATVTGFLNAHRHIVVNVDPEAKTGTCSRCGPVKVWKRGRPGGVVNWRCANKGSERNRMYYSGSGNGHGLSNFQARKLREGRICENPVCNKPAEVVDHCHGTGKIRGVLCNQHNFALGNVHDSIEELEGLIEYLKMTQGVDGLARLGYAG